MPPFAGDVLSFPEPGLRDRGLREGDVSLSVLLDAPSIASLYGSTSTMLNYTDTHSSIIAA